MFRKTITIFSFIGLLVSVGLWGFSTFYEVSHIPRSLRCQVVVFWGVISIAWPDRAYYLITEDQLAAMFEERGIDTRSEDWTPALVGGGAATPGLAIRRVAPEFRFGLRLPRIERRQSKTLGHYAISAPIWLPVSLFAVLLIWSTAPGRRRRKRRNRGQCAECGYDVRGAEGRCPECGTAIARNTTKGGV